MQKARCTTHHGRGPNWCRAYGTDFRIHLSKTLGCGLPLASVSTTVGFERGCKKVGFLWLTMHLIDPLTAAVGNNVLEIVKQESTCRRVAERGDQLRAGLLKLQKQYWCSGDVRGRGLLQGIGIISDAETKAPGSDLGQLVSGRAMTRGLLCNVVNLPGMGGMFRLAPSVTVSAEEIEEGLQVLDEAFGMFLAFEAPGLLLHELMRQV